MSGLCHAARSHTPIADWLILRCRFKTLKTAYATIKGFEVMRALRKGQAAIFNSTKDVRGEARIVERAFGIGPSALTEAVALIARNLEGQTA